ncbi:MAG: hypothetical protein ACXVAX_10985 [Pseudobdellovibrio sp.]
MRALLIVLIFSSVSAFARTYSQNCRAVEDDYLKFSINSDLQKNSDFTLSATAYEDENCKTPYLIFNRYFTIANQSDKTVDLKTEKVTYTVLTDEVARALNQINYCNIHNWQANVETAVTGAKCEDYQQLSGGQIYYQILEANADSLKFGNSTKELTGLAPTLRPTEFDSEIFKP